METAASIQSKITRLVRAHFQSETIILPQIHYFWRCSFLQEWASNEKALHLKKENKTKKKKKKKYKTHRYQWRWFTFFYHTSRDGTIFRKMSPSPLINSLDPLTETHFFPRLITMLNPARHMAAITAEKHYPLHKCDHIPCPGNQFKQISMNINECNEVNNTIAFMYIFSQLFSKGQDLTQGHFKRSKVIVNTVYLPG